MLRFVVEFTFDVSYDETSEELHGIIRLNVRKRRVQSYYNAEGGDRIVEAASFLDACASNYAHWTTEVLPKIALFCHAKGSNHIPIIVDARLHPNLLASLNIVTQGRHEVIFLSRGETLAVQKLHQISCVGYVPFGQRKKRQTGYPHGLFSSHALHRVRSLSIPVALKELEGRKTYTKIFLKRNSNTRNIVNHEQIETLFVEAGYEVIEPEKLNYLEQVYLFNNATHIAGATGAAFANLIYCRENTKILIFMSAGPKSIYWYWQNMAVATGNVVHYILGKAENKNQAHSDFYVSPAVVRKFISLD